ncbi:MAG: hydrogenase expression/formation protein HypE [Desulfatitalea sp.]|nr:hydrogenase expression/formation protein HypE [Desulfatitalea sp.]NNK02042.1 hydrogenase expression/formation protein HypE [Desulfatitalea sp.]
MKNDSILLDHGSGGKMAHQLMHDLLLPLFRDPVLARLHDGALLETPQGRIAFSTDSFVVDPPFFPGGNIGDLAVNGTVNDLAMCGARPAFMSLGLILEEGLAIETLQCILISMAQALERSGTRLVTGDTKVVPRGTADKIFINTSGIGFVPPAAHISGDQARPGDCVILSGNMGDHGIAVLTQRQGLDFESDVISDTAPLHAMVQAILAAAPPVHVLRDPTRGGVATALNEIALQSGVGIEIDEHSLPVAPAVAGICEMLGLDPLHVANEGKLLCLVPEDHASNALAAIQRDPFGRAACIIGRVTGDHPGRVILSTRIGGRRIVDMLSGEQLPRIC